jgi:hypothetical protein
METEDQKVPIKGRKIVPLVNLFSKVSTAVFSTGIKLEPLADWERAKLFENDFLAGSMSWWNKHRTRFKLEHDYPLSSEISEAEKIFPVAAEAIITTLNAIRLHKSGDIGAPVVIDFQFADEPPSEKTTALAYSIGALLGPPKIVGDFYLLDASDIKPISELCDLLRTPILKTNKRLEIALTRFGHLYERNRPEDSILDCFIAFETCLTPTIATELQYRLSLRGAALLCKKRSPIEVRSMLNLGYEMRSKIVHEGRGLTDLLSDPKFQKRATKLPTTQDFPTDVARCVLYYEDLTRELIKEMLDRLSTSPASIESIVEALDDEIAGALVSLI